MEQQKQNKKIRRYPPKMDIIFQAIFGEVGSENITKDFLEKILKRKIEKISLDKNPILRRDDPQHNKHINPIIEHSGYLSRKKFSPKKRKKKKIKGENHETVTNDASLPACYRQRPFVFLRHAL